MSAAANAVTALDARRPDVLVSDIGLPDVDGYTLLERVRTREAARRENPVPAIAVTAWATAADRERAQSAGYQIHLAKPVDASQLVRAIASLAGPDRENNERSRP